MSTHLQNINEFDGIRKVWVPETQQWFFAIVDVIEVLAQPKDPARYWRDMKRRDKLGNLESQYISFRLEHKSNGRTYDTDCANMKGMLRIIQAVPSNQAEPFRLWMAEVGQDRIEEISDPSKALDRAYEIYSKQGYSDQWINIRLQHREVREILISQWKQHISSDQYLELLDIISKETFEYSIAEYKKLKNLPAAENLQNHMTTTELILSALGEVATQEINNSKNQQTYDELAKTAKAGGQIAADARKKIEASSGNKVATDTNFLDSTQKEHQWLRDGK